MHEITEDTKQLTEAFDVEAEAYPGIGSGFEDDLRTALRDIELRTTYHKKLGERVLQELVSVRDEERIVTAEQQAHRVVRYRRHPEAPRLAKFNNVGRHVKEGDVLFRTPEAIEAMTDSRDSFMELIYALHEDTPQKEREERLIDAYDRNHKVIELLASGITTPKEAAIVLRDSAFEPAADAIDQVYGPKQQPKNFPERLKNKLFREHMYSSTLTSDFGVDDVDALANEIHYLTSKGGLSIELAMHEISRRIHQDITAWLARSAKTAVSNEVNNPEHSTVNTKENPAV